MVDERSWQTVAICMTCILSITSLLIVAIVVKGTDGTLLMGGLTLIAGLGGFELGKRTNPQNTT